MTCLMYVPHSSHRLTNLRLLHFAAWPVSRVEAKMAKRGHEHLGAARMSIQSLGHWKTFPKSIGLRQLILVMTWE